MVKIYLFLGGNDGGFTITRDKIYINYGKYINNTEEFIKFLVMNSIIVEGSH